MKKSRHSRHLAAVTFTDIKGYTQLMGENERYALRILDRNREIHQNCFQAFEGHFVKEVGDGTIAWFASSMDAINCMIEIQSTIQSEDYQLRAGIHLGEVLIREGDIFGNSVNIASRIERLATPGGIFITDQVVQSTKGITDFSFVFWKEMKLRNVDHPVRIYFLNHEVLAKPPSHINHKTKGVPVIPHFEILELQGKGGMGVVYKAVDTRLQRPIALKFINPELSKEELAKSRFLQEARTAASIDHPSICTIYEVNETPDGDLFIAMEYISGITLEDKLKQGSLSTKKSIDLALQIAEGLLKAHQTKVIHWDLKPGNIMINEHERVKILDFGLAKIINVPTKKAKNSHGMGTLSYMSPEQIQGVKVDHRTDIWSFGIVCYEMLMNQLPFNNQDEQQVLKEILDEDNPLELDFRPEIPAPLAQLIQTCLEKGPDYRIQNSHELVSALRRIKRDFSLLPNPASGKLNGQTLHPTSTSKLNFRLWMVPLVLLLLLALLGVSTTFFSSAPDSKTYPSPKRLSPVTSSGGLSISPSWSPDGEWIIYATDENGTMDIYKKPIGGGRAIQITTDPIYNESLPSWSPDGRLIAYVSDRNGRQILAVPADSGTPYMLSDFGQNPAWSPNSEQLLFDWQGDIFIIPSIGDEPSLLIAGTTSIPYAIWTSDGENVLYWDRSRADIMLSPIAEVNPVPLNLVPIGETISGLSLSLDGQQLFYAKGPWGGTQDLWTVKLDSTTFHPKGAPYALSLTSTTDVQCTISPDGQQIAFVAQNIERHLYELPLHPETGLPEGEARQLTTRGKLNYYPEFSPDGTELVWTSHSKSKGMLYHMTLPGGEEQKLTSDWQEDVREVFGSFGKENSPIFYTSTRSGSYQIWKIADPGGFGIPITTTTHPTRDIGSSLSPDGKTLAFCSNRSGNWDIWIAPIQGRTPPRQFTSLPGQELYPSWSPDGKKIIFLGDQNGNPDIWTISLESGTIEPLVEQETQESWSTISADGKKLYFVSIRDAVPNIWVKTLGEENNIQAITTYKGHSFGLPENLLYTKFTLSGTRLIIPLEKRKGDVFVMELDTGVPK